MKDRLFRILKALVAYDPTNGYTQGMNFIAAALAIHCEESVTFWLCTGLLEKYEFREVYSSTFSGMYKHINMINILIQKHLPKIHKKFQDVEVMPEMYLTEWILSFMCAYIPMTWLHRYFNEFFRYGWIAFYAICLAIHDFLQDNILEGEDMPSVLLCMKEMKENRESLDCQTQMVDDFVPVEVIKGTEFPQFTPQAKGDDSLPLDFTASTFHEHFNVTQRTKDADWKKIFENYDKYLAKILRKKVR